MAFWPPRVLLLVCSSVPAFLFAPRPNLDYFRSVGGCKAGKCRERKKHQLRRCQVTTRELTGLLPVDYCDYMIGYIFMGCTPNHCHRYCVALPTDEKQPWPGCTILTSTFVYPVIKDCNPSILRLTTSEIKTSWKADGRRK